METYTENEILSVFEAELSTLAEQTYEIPAYETRLTTEIQAKRAEIEAYRKAGVGKKEDVLSGLESLQTELQELITDDATIKTSNDTAYATAIATAKENADTRKQARIEIGNNILRESDWIVAIDAKINDTDLQDWITYRKIIREWIEDETTEIPVSPIVPDIDTDAESVLDKMSAQDDAILGIMEML
jgi:hypothetical protein